MSAASTIQTVAAFVREEVLLLLLLQQALEEGEEEAWLEMKQDTQEKEKA